MIETLAPEATDRVTATTIDELQAFLAGLSRLAGFYEDGLLSEEEFQTAKEKLLQREAAPQQMDSAWF